MNLPALSRAIEARFGCECHLSTHRGASGNVLHVSYDTARLPRSWDAFVCEDDETRRSIEAFLRDAAGAAGSDRIEVEHAARAARTVWLPVGTDGVVAVPAAPDYFRRTGQEASYSPDLYTEHRFKL
jgi:hypothetical protein